ncbi:probable U3 small nucleolar RNA-associated protein 22 [Zygosaccharomyces bailii]|nr:probable U3 small nucleolar RNA-associated protein 22 [Zygosaccharomyces bailii]
MSGVKRRVSEVSGSTTNEPNNKRALSETGEDGPSGDTLSLKHEKLKENSNEREEDVEEEDVEKEDGEDEDTEVNRASSKGSSHNTAAHDIHIVRETAELFKSNIFKLQIDELLQQVGLKDSHILKVEKFLHMLHDLIHEIPAWEERSFAEADSFFKGKIVSIPFVDPKPDLSTTNYKVNYKTPAISLVGSFALKAGIYQPQGSSIDVLLTMPEELFEKKDFLNFRCFHKRSVYLAYLTYHLSILFEKNKMDTFLQLQYSYFNNDRLLPILKLSCKSQGTNVSEFNFHKTKFSINLIIGFPYRVFDAKKLLPNRNCIRVASGEANQALPATPLYNFSVLSSTTYETYLKYLYKTKKQTESFIEASILGRLWLQQRGFSSEVAHSGSLGGFGTFEFTVLMAALLNGGGNNGNKILLHGFSSYQLFKGVIKYLATMDLCEGGHLQFHSDNHSSSKYVEEGFQIPTLYDKTTKVNVLSKISVSVYEILKMHARQTLTMLNDVVRDQFANVFLTNISKMDNIRYDICYDVMLPNGSRTRPEDLTNFSFGPLERIKFISLENFLANKITNAMKYALGDRIKFIELELVGQKSSFAVSKRKVTSGTSSHLNFDHIRIKLLVNPAEAEKLVTKGPKHFEEPTPDATHFKNFWGPKSSLRRFKDGSISHCCVWSTSPSEPVISKIVNFALRRHLSEGCHILNDRTKHLQDLLPLPNLPASSKTSVLNLNSFYNLKKSFDDLYRVIFEMNLPLSVKSILPVGQAFRYTSLCQPVPFAFSSPDFFQEVVLEFETSSKWPDEITSLEKAKTAFLLKIQERIQSVQSDRYKTFFTRDESIPYNLDIVLLNILTPEGYGFRFRILTERDEILYLRAISNAKKELVPVLEKTYMKFTSKYVASVRHTRTVETLAHSLQLYSPVVRLFKKWLDAHLLLDHLSEELMELIALKPFVEYAPYSIPGSVENGFLKILKFLSQWNWKEDPLILDLVKPEEDTELSSENIANFADKMNLSQFKAIQANFHNLRKTDPNGMHVQFFVASKVDPSGILYSSGIPLPIATRLTALSKVAVNLLQAHGLNKQTIDLLFTPALKDYDFVVYLKTPIPLKTSSGILDSAEFKNLTSDQLSNVFPSDTSQLSRRMDPTYQLVKYLNMKYKNSVIFFSHRYIAVNGGEKGDRNVITGLIKPLYKRPHKFRVNMDCNVKPIDEQSVELNRDSIFHEIAAFSNEMLVKFDTE